MDRMKKYMLLAITVALFGEIYFYPLDSSLRISAGIIALNLIILTVDDISEFHIAVSAGVIVFLMRSTISICFEGMPFAGAIHDNLPSITYYLAYGFLMMLLRLRKYEEHFFIAVFLLSLTDSISNIIEVLIRDGMVNLQIVQVLFLTGLARGIAAYFIYLLYKRQELFILDREHQKRYSQLNKLISDIQAEMFYLRKSARDIENVMSKSYELYERHKENQGLKEDALDIAREVHEIKKDYYRVINGFQSFLKDFENSGTMTLKDMLAIIRDNTSRYLMEQDKKITIHFDAKDNFQLRKYYGLFTILNNLIINAIDACSSSGIIKIWEKSDEGRICFKVEDDGEGIEKDVLSHIFNPGFTTKYCDNGKASTGIGLSHVKNIVEELQGNIKVESVLGQGTIFEITIPKKSLLG